jgi:hypothetical protein
MDQEKIAYFSAKFGAYDQDQFEELVSRRQSLADEAIEALDRILAARGLSASAVLAEAAVLRAKEQVETPSSATALTQAVKELSGSRLSMACQVMMGIAVGTPIQNVVSATSIGALWVALVAAGGFYLGYRLGKTITRGICDEEGVSLVTKRKRLWALFAVTWPIWFALLLLSGALVGVT